jgi:hypothetical protein
MIMKGCHVFSYLGNANVGDSEINSVLDNRHRRASIEKQNKSQVISSARAGKNSHK